jgi:uncharacterized protein
MAIPVQCSFVTARPADDVWQQLNDIERVAHCLPGAAITGRVEPSGYLGHISVKLGPVNFRFKGEFKFLEVSNPERRAVAQGKGSDEKGRGAVNAEIVFAVAEHDKGSHTTISANIDLSGMVAQFGRSGAMIQAVAEALVTEFAKNLEQLMSSKSPMLNEKLEPSTRNSVLSQSAPASGVHLIFLALKNLLRRIFSK